MEIKIGHCCPHIDYPNGLERCLRRFGKTQKFDEFLNTFYARQKLGIHTLVATVVPPRRREDLSSCSPEDIPITVFREVVGSLSYFIEPKFIHNGGLVGHIEDVCVALGYEREGVGSALISAAKGIFEHAGCYKAILDCSNENVAFYQKLGFRQYENCMRIDF